MENRDQKRHKSDSSSSEFEPSSSNSSPQTPMASSSSTHEPQDAQMNIFNSTSEKDSSASTSVSSQSDGEPENHSYYDSDNYHEEEGEEYQPTELYAFTHRSAGNSRNLQRILSTLQKDIEASEQLSLLTDLCEVLSFCMDNCISNAMANSLSPLLVKLAGPENTSDIMLLAIRAITYLCDVYPRASGILIRHNAVPAICQRLIAIEDMDVAEQCLQALAKISREEPHACLQAGSMMAVLSYIDFFSTSIQRVAITTVVNICKKLPSKFPSSLMEAVPILCNLLQYEDSQIVENVATCLIKIVDRVSQCNDILDELCNHRLIHQVVPLITMNRRSALPQPIYNGLIGLLVKLASGSFISFRSLYELNISNILKDHLSTIDLSHGMPSPHMVDGHCNQVYEALKLLNVLLPTSGDLGLQLMQDRKLFLCNHPDLLQRFGADILPVLIQVVNSGANLYICYCCLSIMRKFLQLSESDLLLELFKNTNISGFLIGVFTRKDQHVLTLALQIAEMILEKLSDSFFNSFIKEGVFFLIDALATPGKCSSLGILSLIHPPFNITQKMAANEVHICLCHAFDAGPDTSASEMGSCKLEKDYVRSLAQDIRNKYFSNVLTDYEKEFTNILQKLKTLSAELEEFWSTSSSSNALVQHDDNFKRVLYNIMAEICGREPISTFEFVESGIIKSLVSFLSNGYYLKVKAEVNGAYGISDLVGKRFAVFAMLCLFPLDSQLEDLPLLVLIRKLQSALTALEDFPIISSYMPKRKNSFATVPLGQIIAHPCLKVHFVRGDGETYLCDHCPDFLTVDPLSYLNDIETFLWPKVSKKNDEQIGSAAQSTNQVECQHLQLPIDQGENADPVDSDPTDDMSSDLPNVQQRSAGPESQFSSEAHTSMKICHHASCSNEKVLPKLQFYLQGQQLDPTLTIYQSILQQQIKEEPETLTSAKLWNKTYTVTYTRATDPKESICDECLLQAVNSSLSHDVKGYTSFFSSLFACELASDLEKSNPTYEILFLLRSLHCMKRFTFNFLCHENIAAFVEGRSDNFDNLKVTLPSVPQNEFVNSKLTEKLEQLMKDALAGSVGGLPLWCNQLMTSCPFLFGFEARHAYFKLAAVGLGSPSVRKTSSGGLPRRKFLVSRDQILHSASQMIAMHACHRTILQVEYNEEVGTGLGPTLEFYTLVSHEFQKYGMGMWREDNSSFASRHLQQVDIGLLMSPFGLFPRPWSSALESSDGIQFSEVMQNFVLLGQVVAKALHDGRVLDLPFSKAFYKLILEQELSVYDIPSFDPELGQTLLEFQCLVDRKRYLDSACSEDSTIAFASCFRGTRIEDLYLDFSLPGYPDYFLINAPDNKTVNMSNLEDYISLMVDATINSGIYRQMEAFKSGFNQVFPIKHLQIFTEDELERVLCGETDSWAFNELLDHLKFDHGYTVSSPPILNLLEILTEFDRDQRRGFLQFVTGAPRLPPGGLASLDPKLTVVRKHCSKSEDAELPSVMTCANYLKLPPYSSKEIMKEKILYAISEGQGSFHLS